MPTKDDLTNERRAQILQAAAAVFARSGIDGARMDDIVTESGLSKGTLYWYFDSKEEIIVALVDEVVHLEYDNLRALVDGPGTVVERLQSFLDAHAGILNSQPLMGKLGLEFFSMTGRIPRVHQFMKQYYDDYLGILVTIFEQGQERGEFDAEVERPQDLAVHFVGLIEGLTLLWALDVERVNLSEQFHGALSVLLGDSIASREAP
jgi:TetR/AcrR family fatty acid metabolism transcriptional regulator